MRGRLPLQHNQNAALQYVTCGIVQVADGTKSVGTPQPRNSKQEL